MAYSNKQDNTLDSETWNIAQGFAYAKVLMPLIQIDSYMDVAMYGVEELGQEEFISPNKLALNRRDGLKRATTTLLKVLRNVKFKINDKDKTKFDTYIVSVKMVFKHLDNLLEVRHDDLTKQKEIKINEEYFKLCYDILQRILEEINTPLNNAGLIFKITDEIDLDKIKLDIIKGG